MDTYRHTFKSWNNVAQRYKDIFMDLDLYNNTYNRFCSLVKKQGAHILEIGCGPGNITRRLIQQRPDFTIHATDIAPNMIGLAQQANPTASFSILDARHIDTLTNKYDGIMCGFTLPYLSREDTGKFIAGCAGLLTGSGVLYLSAIEGNYADSGYEAGSTGDTMYVYYYTESYISTLLTENGFGIQETTRIPFTRQNGKEEVHFIIIASLNAK